MNQVYENIRKELDLIVKSLASLGNNEPLSISQGNWSFPGITRGELIQEAQELLDKINEFAGDSPPLNEGDLNDYTRRLTYLRGTTIPYIFNGNAALGVSAYQITLRGLDKVLRKGFPPVDPNNTAKSARGLNRTVTAIEARLKELEPRYENLADMISRIENAHDAAEQLPTDLVELAEARNTIKELAIKSNTDGAFIKIARDEATTIRDHLKDVSKEAEEILAKSESAYSAATSVGLSASFSERSEALSNSMWIWVLGFILALVAGALVGEAQLSELNRLLQYDGVSFTLVAIRVLLSILAVGAPIWFGWLAAKQIGQRFRLSEDYAFKAAISRAYEGYRKEAARHGSDMELKLLTSALARFDELPLRVVEAETHGSPWHEFLASDAVKEAFKKVPGLGERLMGVVKDALTQNASKVPEAPKKEP